MSDAESASKVSLLALGASGAMLLHMLGSDHSNEIALRAYQRDAIQTKLEQMAPENADSYIRKQVDGTYLDYWLKNDTNGTLIAEYVDYAMDSRKAEKATKAEAKAEFKKLKKFVAVPATNTSKEQLQQKIDELQKQLDELEEKTK